MMSIIDSQEPAYREEHEIDVLDERIGRLEELVRDMWVYLSAPDTEFPCCEPVCREIRERIAALGIEVVSR